MRKLIAILSMAVIVGMIQPAIAGESELAGTSWLIDDIGGRGVVDRARTTLEFLEPGRIGGRTGCNRFFGRVVLDGDRITVGNLGLTRMACSESLMDQEQRFVDALGNARRLELAHGGLILNVFDDVGRRLLELSRIVEK